MLFAGALAMCLLGTLVWTRSEAELDRDFDVAVADLELRRSEKAEQSDRGRHLASVVAQCHFCHGPDLAGRELADDPLVGRLFASNLTAGRGGVAATYTRADWVRAIRFGVGRDGRSLLLMPSAHLSRMSDEDLAAVIDYLGRIPAVDAELPATRIGWLTRLALAAGAAPDLLSAALVDRTRRAPIDSKPERTHDYGRYLVDLGSCRVCHHPDLRGGRHALSLPGEPVAPDLRRGGALEDWTLDDFRRAMREGLTPSRRPLDRNFMPWPAFAGLSDLEVEAIWVYLRSLDADPAPGLEIAQRP